MHICRNLILYLCILVLRCTLGYSKIQITGNGYTGITVALPLSVASDERDTLISFLKELFESSSRALYVATKRRAYIRSVTFMIPKSWHIPESWIAQNESITEDNGGQDPLREVDILVTNSVEIINPFTVQAQSCGQEGIRIYLPRTFILSKKPVKEKGVQFVHYFAQYRYGVYPEGGFLHDERYPLYYAVPGSTDIKLTACTNIPISFNFTNSVNELCTPEVNINTGKPESSDCWPQVHPQQFLSSLLFQQALPNVFEFCDSDASLEKSHNSKALSKHNILCSGESPGVVILRSPDFYKGRNQATRFKLLKMTYNYVQESSLRIIIAIDVSSKMSQKERYALIKNSLNKFILITFPLGSEVGLLFFDENIILAPDALITLATEESKIQFLESGAIPEDTTSLSTSDNGKAISSAIQVLKDEKRNGVIFLVTSNSSVSISSEISASLVSNRIRLSVLLLVDVSNLQPQSEPGFQNLTSLTGGEVFDIPEDDTKFSLSHMYLAFSKVISHVKRQNILMVHDIIPGLLDVELPFTVDLSSAQDISLIITGSKFNAMNSPFVEDSTELISPTGEHIRVQKQYNIPAWMFKVQSPQVGNYVFKTKWKNISSGNALVVVYGNPVEQKPSITVDIWTDIKDGKVIRAAPVKLFAEVRFSSHPIINAEVTATIFNPDGDHLLSFSLFDNGIGDPDITLNDGVYSRYLTDFELPGYHNIVVEVTDNKNASKILYMSPDYCCGSFIPADRLKPTGVFSRIVGPISLMVNKRTNFMEDAYPPNRILDLQITKVDLESRMYTLRWSAAGNDYDHGIGVGRQKMRESLYPSKPAAYRIKLFSELSEARRRFQDTGYLLEYNRDIIQHSSTAQFGVKQEFIVRVPDTFETGNYYIAVQAVDDANNTGGTSNIVQFFLRNDKRVWDVVCDKDDGNTGVVNYAVNLYLILTVLLLICE